MSDVHRFDATRIVDGRMVNAECVLASDYSELLISKGEMAKSGLKVIDELRDAEAKIADLQQRLNAADQRVDDLAPERSPKDFAIEHAEYLATAAESVGEHFNAYGLALMALEEADEDSDSDELLDSLDFARSELQESLSRLRNMTYEFRKRRDRATQ